MSVAAAHPYGGTNPVFRTSSAVPPWCAVLVAFLAFFAAQTLTWDTAAWIALGALLLAAIPRRVEVGAEGLRIAWLGTGRVVRYEDVRRAEPFGPDGVSLTFLSGETVRLARGDFDAASPRDVLERLWSTLSLGAEEGARPNERAALCRGERAVEDWLADLRGLAARGAHYRQGLLPLDRLLSLATNPAVEVEIRGAAAVAYGLAGAVDDAMRDELRAIASLTVDETLRESFVRIAEGDLLGALRELA